MTSRRLDAVRRWLRHKEHAAARIVDAARRERAKAVQQLDDLDALRAEYLTALRERTAAGASAEEMRAFHGFLGSLEAARRAQQVRVEAEQQTATRANEFWLRAYRERLGVDTLVERRAERERHHEQKTANRDASERHVHVRRDVRRDD